MDRRGRSGGLVALLGSELAIDRPRRNSEKLRGELFVSGSVLEGPVNHASLDLAQRGPDRECEGIELRLCAPAHIHTVLDVGCGNGDNAVAMIEKGLQVEGLAPDPLQQANFLERTNGKALFHVDTFQEFVKAPEKVFFTAYL